jgi:GMP synthase (glutamine-hydrolysing)
MILVLDFGGQYNQLIARRVRECNVYCEVHNYDISIDEIKAKNPKGIIFTGGPSSVYEDDSPKIDEDVYKLGVPILGLCYGAQMMTHQFGG